MLHEVKGFSPLDLDPLASRHTLTPLSTVARATTYRALIPPRVSHDGFCPVGLACSGTRAPSIGGHPAQGRPTEHDRPRTVAPQASWRCKKSLRPVIACRARVSPGGSQLGGSGFGSASDSSRSI